MEQRNGGSFSENDGPKHIKLTIVAMSSILYLHTDTDKSCMHICILTADYTVKSILSGHLKKKTNYHLMQVKSIAGCSKGAFCNPFDLH